MSKRFFTVTLLVLSLTTTLASAKDFELGSLYVGSGKGVLSSGLGGTLELSSGEQTAFISADDSQIYCNYLFNKAGIIEEYITGGFFNNTPWIGPMLCAEPQSPLSYCFWIGWSLGDMVNKTDIANGQQFFIWNQLTLDLSEHITVGSAMLHYQRQAPKHVPGILVKMPIGHGARIQCAMDYDTREKELLCTAGVKITFGG